MRRKKQRRRTGKGGGVQGPKEGENGPGQSVDLAEVYFKDKKNHFYI